MFPLQSKYSTNFFNNSLKLFCMHNNPPTNQAVSLIFVCSSCAWGKRFRFVEKLSMWNKMFFFFSFLRMFSFFLNRNYVLGNVEKVCPMLLENRLRGLCLFVRVRLIETVFLKQPTQLTVFLVLCVCYTSFAAQWKWLFSRLQYFLFRHISEGVLKSS